MGALTLHEWTVSTCFLSRLLFYHLFSKPHFLHAVKVNYSPFSVYTIINSFTNSLYVKLFTVKSMWRAAWFGFWAGEAVQRHSFFPTPGSQIPVGPLFFFFFLSETLSWLNHFAYAAPPIQLRTCLDNQSHWKSSFFQFKFKYLSLSLSGLSHMFLNSCGAFVSLRLSFATSLFFPLVFHTHVSFSG